MRSRRWRVPRFRLWGAPVFLHWSALAVAFAVFVLSLQTPFTAVLIVLCYLGVITLHEAGHAFVASRCRLAVHEVKIGWFHGHVFCEAPSDRHQAALVAWGGPGAQLAVAAVVFALSAVPALRAWQPFGVLLVVLGYVSVMLAVVNLAPARGLDGATAWQILPSFKLRARGQRRSRRKANPLRRVK
jgi:Zn-dependent protease